MQLCNQLQRHSRLLYDVLPTDSIANMNVALARCSGHKHYLTNRLANTLNDSVSPGRGNRLLAGSGRRLTNLPHWWATLGLQLLQTIEFIFT